MTGHLVPYHCHLCGLAKPICVCDRKPVEPGSEGAKWLEQRRQERAARPKPGLLIRHPPRRPPRK